MADGREHDVLELANTTYEEIVEVHLRGTGKEPMEPGAQKCVGPVTGFPCHHWIVLSSA